MTKYTNYLSNIIHNNSSFVNLKNLMAIKRLSIQSLFNEIFLSNKPRSSKTTDLREGDQLVKFGVIIRKPLESSRICCKYDDICNLFQ